MIPTKTGAAAAVGLVLPELKGKLDGFSMRVPTINVSLVDLTFSAEARDHGRGDEQAGEGRRARRSRASSPTPTRRWCRSDFNHDPASSTYDATLTKVIDGTLVKVCSWYDNEWGFSNRMLDTALAWRGRSELHGGAAMKVLRMAELRLRGKRVLIREDLNVPVQDGRSRATRASAPRCPTIQLALEQGARVILMSHLGRPKEGKFDPELSLAPVARALGAARAGNVPLREGVARWRRSEPGQVVLLRERALQQGREEGRRSARASTWRRSATST